MPDGGAILASAICRCSVVGKRKEAETATRDAKNVPTTYSPTMGFMASLASAFFWAMAFMTKTKTRTGATPFRALTKRSPKMATTGTRAGAVSAMMIPMRRPMAMSLMRAVSSYFFPIVPNKTISSLNSNYENYVNHVS